MMRLVRPSHSLILRILATSKCPAARWDNAATPDVTSLLTKGRADALYLAATTGQGIIRFVQDHASLNIASLNDLAVDNDPDWPNQQYMIRIGGGAVPTDGFPGMGAGDFVQSLNWGGQAAIQMGFDAAGSDAIMYVRRKNAGTWGPWIALDPTATGLLTGTDDLDTVDIGSSSKKTFRVSGVPSNGFTGIGSGDWVEMYQYSATAATQQGLDFQTGKWWQRSKVSGTWQAWTEMGASGPQHFVSTADPTPTDGADGDLWFKVP